MEDLFARASNEAKAAFGDGGMFIEKYLVGAPGALAGRAARGPPSPALRQLACAP